MDIKSLRMDIKIIVIGNTGTGKTCFVNKYTKGTYSDTYSATIVSEFNYKIYEQDDSKYRIQIWDLAGQDKDYLITKLFAKDAHGCIIMCDVTNLETREKTLAWKKSVNDVAEFIDGKELPCILIESKADLIDSYEKDSESLKKFGEDNGFIGAFRVSTKKDYNVNDSIEYLIRKIIKRVDAYEEKLDKEEGRKEEKCEKTYGRQKRGNIDISERAVAVEKKNKCC